MPQEPLKHVIEAQQLTVDLMEEEIFPLADKMKDVVEIGGSHVLSGKRMVALFYEPSTRTRASFEIAMNMLGGTVVFSTENAREFSSAAKGETLRDTILVLNRYHPHVIVIRHHVTDSVKTVSEISSVPIINAGDGRGQHPTQALLDLYTIKKRFGNVNGLTVAMVGDLKNGRTIRSLSYLLAKYTGVKICFVAPNSLRVGDDIKDYLTRHKVSWQELYDLREVAHNMDVVYMTRTQKERGSVIDPNDKGFFIVDSLVLGLMKRESIIMHPLPRNDEISLEVDSDPRAVYLTEQVSAGLYTRMALLFMVIRPNP